MGKFEDFLEKHGILAPDDPDNIIEGAEDKKSATKASKVISGNTTVTQNPAAVKIPKEGNTEFDPTAVVKTNIIEEAYANLGPETADVYLIEQLEQNFNMLPEVQRPAVICNTLTTMGKDITTLLGSVETRKTALQAKFSEYSENIANENEILAKKIEEYQQKIDICKQGQLDRQNNLQAASVAVATESAKLDKINKILGGTN